MLHLCGPRQTGKSSLLREWLAPGQTVLRMDLAVLGDAGRGAALDASRAGGSPETLLVDDAHLLPDWQAQADAVSRQGIRLVLAGQHDPRDGEARIDLWPWSFRRFLAARSPSCLRGVPPAMPVAALLGDPAEVRDVLWAVHRAAQRLGRAWEGNLADFTRRGGYPGALHLSQAPDYLLAQVVERALGLDAPARAPIEQPALLRRIFAELARRTGTEVSQGELARDLGAAQPVVGRYFDHLEGVGLVRVIRRHPFAPGARVPSKMLLADIGLREAVLRERADPYERPIAETILQASLRDPEIALRFWRDYEKPSDRRSTVESVSLVLAHPDERVVPLQLSAGPEPTVADERALRSFVSRFAAPLGLLVTRDAFAAPRGDPVLRVPLRDLLVALA